ncbi:hypothetical protein [Acidovorax sp. sic0104]|uniref:hypothetical protein n=1 Tax=Acidovorax sp. sic0104 TaxID=2854784 RepID=UPI001C46EC22|nr:hypothetical protein [Acidovorax sp. sic0104]MBV7544557.1 hypothetical protein [Acidovorax sp. sic0104]
MRALSMALLAAGCLVHAGQAVAAQTLEELLAASPAAAAQAAAHKGDTRFMGVPACVANQVPGMPFEPTAWWKGQDRIEPLECETVVGQAAVERMGQLRQFAKEYNLAMLAHVRAHGLYPLYPWDAEPNHQPTPAQQKLIAAQAEAALDAFYAPKRPASVDLHDDVGAWMTAGGKLSRLFVSSKVDAADWKKAFPSARWKSVATPRDFVRTAHKVAPTYTGMIGGKPAYLFVSPERGGEILLGMVLIYDTDEPAIAPAQEDARTRPAR